MAVVDLPHLGPGSTTADIANWAAILKGSLETAFTELGNAVSGAGTVVRGPPGPPGPQGPQGIPGPLFTNWLPVAVSSTVALNLGLGNNWNVSLQGGNVLLDNPVNPQAGQEGWIEITQDSVTPRSLTFGTNWYFQGGTPPVVTNRAGAQDYIFYKVRADFGIVAIFFADIKKPAVGPSGGIAMAAWFQQFATPVAWARRAGAPLANGISPYSGFTPTWYVTKTGSNANDGKSLATAWLTIQFATTNAAVQAGDQIVVGAGTYVENIGPTRGGDAIRGNVKLISAVRRAAKIQGAANSASVTPFCNYWTIQGFEIQGFAGGTEHGIDLGRSDFLHAHHVAAIDCDIHDHGGGGYAGAWGDYYTVTDCDIHGNCGNNGNQTSGLSAYQPQAFDTLPGFHNIYARNRIWANTATAAMAGNHTDGNGIIIDDGNQTQTGAGHQIATQYTMGTLIENNLVVNNGGKGIHVYLTQFVTARYNTAFKNHTDPAASGTWWYEIGTQQGNNNNFYGNIAVCDSSGVAPHNANFCFGNMDLAANTGCNFNNNLTLDTANLTSNSFQNPGNATNSAWLFHTDPLFVNGNIDPAVWDFHLQNASPAIVAGTTTHPVDDITHRTRAYLTAADLGAYMH